MSVDQSLKDGLDPVASVEKLEVGPGDLLHVRVGVENMGGDLPPWLPTEEDLEYVREEFARALPEARVLVTHCGIEFETHPYPAVVVIESKEDCDG